jgi:hypothetical protein
MQSKKFTYYLTLQAETVVAFQEFRLMRPTIVLIVAHGTCNDIAYVVRHVSVAVGENLL